MSKLISTEPYYGDDGTTGTTAVWDSEPTIEQQAEYVSNEWTVGQTYAPEYYRELWDSDNGIPGNIIWRAIGVLFIFAVVVTIITATIIALR